MSWTLRAADRDDVAAIMRVRHSVLENRLVSRQITTMDVVAAIEDTGRGWVVDVDGDVVAFTIGNAETGQIWALFVDPAHERNGYGRALLQQVTRWLFSHGHERLWLTTDRQTRAHHVYLRAGWQHVRDERDGEILLELRARPPQLEPDTGSSVRCSRRVDRE